MTETDFRTFVSRAVKRPDDVMSAFVAGERAQMLVPPVKIWPEVDNATTPSLDGCPGIAVDFHVIETDESVVEEVRTVTSP